MHVLLLETESGGMSSSIRAYSDIQNLRFTFALLYTRIEAFRDRSSPPGLLNHVCSMNLAGHDQVRCCRYSHSVTQLPGHSPWSDGNVSPAENVPGPQPHELA